MMPASIIINREAIPEFRESRAGNRAKAERKVANYGKLEQMKDFMYFAPRPMTIQVA